MQRAKTCGIKDLFAIISLEIVIGYYSHFLIG
jgi:hypothetical protein